MIRIFLLLFTLSGSIAISGQTPSPTPMPDENGDFQQWNDVSITQSLNKRVDLVLPLTLRLGTNLTRLQETRVGIGFGFKVHSRVTLTPGYNFIYSRNSAGNLIRENRLTFAAGIRLPVSKVGVSHRSLFEYRIRTTGKTWRYRTSGTVEKALPESWLKGSKIFVTDEVFYDSRAKRFSRNRLSMGINKSLSKKLSVDVYYVRQDDTTSLISPFHAVGVHWRLRL